jgi:decaprenylphospho-beta-D-erythro-pentofuranosid-2-ulose 2-reductase
LSLLTVLANLFEKQSQGVIAVLTSVAGDRGRASNYVYGASKAAVSTFVSGLRVRLASHGVSVVDIKPGPIETAMTAHMKKGLLFSKPNKIAPLIVRAMDKNLAVSYVPGIWCWIMSVIRNLPDFVFKKLKNL